MTPDMKNIIKKTVIITLLFACYIPADAQLTRERITHEPFLINGVHHSYRHGDMHDTPAPRGYKAFYVSHAGRHGSRYDLDEGYGYEVVLETLGKASEAGILTATGNSLFNDIKTLHDNSEGMYEMLTQRGAEEHRQISARMMDRFSDVFTGKKRDEVDAVSSTVQRCVLSMSNFCLQIAKEKPSLKITMDTGDKYMRYLMHWDSKGRSLQTTVEPDSRAYLAEHFDTERLYSSLFTSTTQAKEFCDPYKFEKYLFNCASLAETMEMEYNVNIYRYLTEDEIFVLAADHSDRFYAQNANSLLYGDKTAEQGRRMLKDFIEKADAALSSESHRAADLRFTHDTQLLPFATLLAFDGMDKKMPQNQAHEVWCAGEMIPMGSNFQMIFYKSRKTDTILVKMLYNEQERTIAGVPAVSGPYYDWSVLRSHFLSLCEKE